MPNRRWRAYEPCNQLAAPSGTRGSQVILLTLRLGPRSKGQQRTSSVGLLLWFGQPGIVEIANLGPPGWAFGHKSLHRIVPIAPMDLESERLCCSPTWYGILGAIWIFVTIYVVSMRITFKSPFTNQRATQPGSTRSLTNDGYENQLITQKWRMRKSAHVWRNLPSDSSSSLLFP